MATRPNTGARESKAAAPGNCRWAPAIERLDSHLSLALRSLAGRPGLATLLVLAVAAAAFLPGLFDLPPIDRTEVRYAQTSKQILETGDWIAPRLQGEPQFTKPIGIYWAQAGVVRLIGEGAYHAIWAYRLPSGFAALLAVLSAFWGARRWFGAEAALIGALLLAVNLIVVLQAHLALSKAIHLVFVVVAQWSLARLYVDSSGANGTRDAALFWAAQGLSIMAGALALPLLSLSTVLGLIAADRSAAWLNRLRPLWGVPLMLALAAPWLIALALNPETELVRAVWSDGFLGKIAGPQEMNYRAPPGIFVAGSWLGFLPAVIFLPMALVHLWRGRGAAPNRFLLAWIFGYLLALEALSGKPPLYSLQSIMPAIAVAVGMMLADRATVMPERAWARRLNGGLALLHDALPGLALIALLWLLAPPVLLAPALLAAVSLAAVASGVATALREKPIVSLVFSIAGVLALYWGALQLALPAFERIWLSQRMAAVAKALKPCVPGPAGIAGYAEPSAVFLLGTSTHSAKGPQAGAVIAPWLAQADGRFAFVSSRADSSFRAALQASRLRDLEPIGCVRGLNFGRFEWLTLKVYANAKPQALAACPLPGFARCSPPQTD